MSNLADLSAVELVSAYKAKSLSPVEVTEAVITRIEAYEPKLNALWAYDPDAARVSAKASEARWGKGEPAGPAAHGDGCRDGAKASSGELGRS